MIAASLLEFAITGNLGPIALGISRSDVYSLLGAPPLWSTSRHVQSAVIWRYQDIEIYFKNNLVEMIFTDHDDINN